MLFEKNIDKREGWQNNPFNERIYKELPRKFSIEDGDGIIRFEYIENGSWRTRLIIYEFKRYDEKEIEEPQLKTLSALQRGIDWQKFDNRSGVFIIKAVENNSFDKTEITQIVGQDNKSIPILNKIGIVDFNYYHNWFYNFKL